MKKILSVFLAVVMAFGVLPAVALAAAPVEITAATYQGIAAVVLGEGKDYKLTGNAVIEEGQSWTVEEGSNLMVYGTLEIKGTLTVNGYVTGFGSDGKVLVRCWNDGGTYKYGTVINEKNVCGNESENSSGKRYFVEIHMPQQPYTDGFSELGGAPQMFVKYMFSFTGSASDYLRSDAAFTLLDTSVSTADYNKDTGMLTAPLNQYLFMKFKFANPKKYDGEKVAILFNRVPHESAQGVCIKKIEGPGVVEYYPAALINTGVAFTVWEDSYFLREERIYIPSGTGYTAFGINGEVGASGQTVRLKYGEEFKFRVNIDKDYSDSAVNVYLVKGYQWDPKTHQGSMDDLLDAVYMDENNNPQHYAWKFVPQVEGEHEKAFIDEYGVYHIASVDDEYTIVINGVLSNETLSVSAGIIDTIRNLLNALKQFFARIKQMLGR